MMQQQQFPQQQRRQNYNKKKNRLAAAFALQSRGQSLEDQSAFVPAEQQQYVKQACPLPVDDHVVPTSSHQQPEVEDIANNKKPKHEAISFLEEHGVPTFVPVFETVESIEPKSNESLRGQVPWKCAFCHNHSFGHHCQGCVRHRDAAALRIFVGQLCKEGTQDVVSKMVEVLCPDLSAPAIFVEPHTDANTGRGKGCAWIYVHTLEDIPYVVKCLNKRTFVTVDENSGNVGFVAFPSSFSNSEIEEAFQIDHDAQTPELQSLFLFTCIAAQVPKAFHSWGLLKNHNNNNNLNMNMNKKFVPATRNHQYPRVQQHQQQQQQVVLPPPPPPTYGSSLPPPPTFSPVTKNTTSSNNNQTVVVDNRQYEEQQQQYEQMLIKAKQQQQQQQQNVLMTKPSTTSPSSSSSSSSSSATPKVFLGNEPTASTHFTCPVPQSQQVHQASWVNDVQDDDNYFITRQQQQQHQQNHQHQRQVSSTSSSSVGHRYPQQQQQQRYQHYPYQY